MADTETFDISVDAATKLANAFDSQRAPAAKMSGREPDDTWKLSHGVAWVWRCPGTAELTRPVLIADGFGAGASTLGEWAGLWQESEVPGVYPWGTRLHEAGRAVIVVGYDSRNAPIRENAEVAIEAIVQARDEQDGPLVVGGLSMGGLVTRYALARLEDMDEEHRVSTYFSYDSPHRGAWIPISLQVFAHFLAGIANQLITDPEKKEALLAMQRLINSPAARELLWKHTETHIDVGPHFEADPARDEFLRQLEAVGGWPQIPMKLAVANGRGDGTGLPDVEPGEANLVWPAAFLQPSATLYAQSEGSMRLVAELVRAFGAGKISVNTSDIPALDGAPGGTLDSFDIAARALQEAGYDATAAFPDVCFVPVGSAVDLCDPSDPFSPINTMDPDHSGLDAFEVASDNEPHTLLTEALCDWLTEHFV